MQEIPVFVGKSPRECALEERVQRLEYELRREGVDPHSLLESVDPLNRTMALRNAKDYEEIVRVACCPSSQYPDGVLIDVVGKHGSKKIGAQYMIEQSDMMRKEDVIQYMRLLSDRVLKQLTRMIINGER